MCDVTSEMLGGSSSADLAAGSVWMKISPPCEVSMWLMVLVLVALRCISSITERPDNRKLVRQELCRLLTSVGVILDPGGQYLAVKTMLTTAFLSRKHFDIGVKFSVQNVYFIRIFCQLFPRL